MSCWSCCDSQFFCVYILKCFVVCVGRSGGGRTGTVCHVGAAVTVSYFLLNILKCFVECVGRSGGGGTGTVCHVGAAVTESVFCCCTF